VAGSAETLLARDDQTSELPVEGDARRERAGRNEPLEARLGVGVLVAVDRHGVVAAEADGQVRVVQHRQPARSRSERRAGRGIGLERAADLLLRSVDRGDRVVVGVGDEQVRAHREQGARLEADRKRAHLRAGDEVDLGHRAGGGDGAVAVGDDRRAVRVVGVVAGLRRTAALVADVGLAVDHGDVVGHVADRDLLAQRVGGRVEDPEGVVRAQGDEQVGAVRCPRQTRGDGLPSG
jgi:hypothetical protein